MGAEAALLSARHPDLVEEGKEARPNQLGRMGPAIAEAGLQLAPDNVGIILRLSVLANLREPDRQIVFFRRQVDPSPPGFWSADILEQILGIVVGIRRQESRILTFALSKGRSLSHRSQQGSFPLSAAKARG